MAIGSLFEHFRLHLYRICIIYVAPNCYDMICYEINNHEIYSLSR